MLHPNISVTYSVCLHVFVCVRECMHVCEYERDYAAGPIELGVVSHFSLSIVRMKEMREGG